MSVMGKGNSSYGVLHASNFQEISSGTSLVNFLLAGDSDFVDLQSESLRATFSRITGNELREVDREILELFELNNHGPYGICVKSRDKNELKKEVRKEISEIRRLAEAKQ